MFQETQKMFIIQKSNKFIDRRICALLILVKLVVPRITRYSSCGTLEIKASSRGYQVRKGRSMTCGPEILNGCPSGGQNI